MSLCTLVDDADGALQDVVDYLGAEARGGVVTALEPLARGDAPGTLETSGYVVHSLQTALHDGRLADSVEEASYREVQNRAALRTPRVSMRDL